MLEELRTRHERFRNQAQKSAKPVEGSNILNSQEAAFISRTLLIPQLKVAASSAMFSQRDKTFEICYSLAAVYLCPLNLSTSEINNIRLIFTGNPPPKRRASEDNLAVRQLVKKQRTSPPPAGKIKIIFEKIF